MGPRCSHPHRTPENIICSSYNNTTIYHLEDPGGDGPDLVDEAAAHLAPGAGLRVIAQALLVTRGAALSRVRIQNGTLNL